MLHYLFRRFFYLCMTILLFHTVSQGQNKPRYTISGYVKDAKTGEYLIGANVYLKELLKGTSTNQYGFYSLTVDQGEYTLVVKFLGLRLRALSVMRSSSKRPW